MVLFFLVLILVLMDVVRLAMRIAAIVSSRRYVRQSGALVDERHSLRSGPASWANTYKPLDHG